MNYDARYASDIGLDNEMFKMSASNHHLKSLGHSPDLIGLFFSVLDQFTGTSSFISNGRIIRVVKAMTANLNFKEKLLHQDCFAGSVTQ